MAWKLLYSSRARREIAELTRRTRRLMEQELLLNEHFLWQGQSYPIRVYRHTSGKARCSHVAETALGPDDYVISDGSSVEEVLHKQQTILPLAILSRAIVKGKEAIKDGVGLDDWAGHQPGKLLPGRRDRRGHSPAQ
jgi:hypothetical protein